MRAVMFTGLSSLTTSEIQPQAAAGFPFNVKYRQELE